MTDESEKASDRRRVDRYEPLGDHFVLITLPSGDERLEPLINLSAQGVAVLLRTQRYDLQPGQFIPRVRFFTEGECTLQCQARIREVSQISMEDGGVGVKVGLRLELPEVGSDPTSHTDTYDEPQIITDTLLNVIKARATVRLHSIAESRSGAVEVKQPIRMNRNDETLTVVLSEQLRTKDDSHTLPPGDICELSGELYGTRLALHVEVISHDGLTVTLRWPSQLVVWRHRVGGRLRRLPERVEVSFEAPFSRQRCTREVIDVSANGLALVAEPSDGLMVGMLVPELSMHLSDGLVRSRGVVRNVRHDSADRLLVGIEMIGQNSASARVLQHFVDRHLHPRVRHAELRDLRNLWPVYERVGLFERQHAAVSPLMATVETTRQTLLTRAHSLNIHLVGGHDDEIYGSAELIRIYRRTWFLQHLGVLPAWQLTADQLVVPLVETALRRNDFDQLYALLDPTSSRLGLSRLRAAQPDASHLDWSELSLFTDSAPETRRFDRREVQDAGPGDRAWLVERLSSRFSHLQRATLDLDETELSLETIGRAYHEYGLDRKRRVRVAISVSGPLGFSLIETTSPGANFQGHLDLVRIIPTLNDEVGRREAVLLLARDAVQIQLHTARRRSLILCEPRDAQFLNDTEFEHVGNRIEIFASRSGAAQIVNFVNLLT